MPAVSRVRTARFTSLSWIFGLLLVSFQQVYSPQAVAAGAPAISTSGAPVLQNIISIAAGDNHTCALTSEGVVYCWGMNDASQLGEDALGSPSHPIRVKGLPTNIAAIAAGSSHTCALTSTGGAMCWGANHYGQLGYKRCYFHFQCVYSPIPGYVSGLQTGVKAIAAGSTFTCALLTSGGVKCWGLNDVGQLGDGHRERSTFDPVDVDGLTSGAKYLAAGGGHSCAVTSSGSVMCWGSNLDGQLGDGTNEDRFSPVLVKDLDGAVRAITAASAHSCALTGSGAAVCWGRNDNGELGDGTHTSRNVPGEVVGAGTDLTAIAAGGAHTCVLTNDNSESAATAVLCWGENGSGQVGSDDLSNHLVPVEIPTLRGMVRSTSLGSQHTCAVISDGRAKCWGANGSGQLGNGDIDTMRLMPTPVYGLSSGVQSISVSPFHSCAVVNNGVACWGSNAEYQLGIDGNVDGRRPVLVPNLGTNIKAVTAARNHTCALDSDGAVWCWGTYLCGLIPDGGMVCYHHVPTPVAELTQGISAISASSDYTCALTDKGGVKCWGANSSGVLGDGTRTWRLAPVAVSGLDSGVQAISTSDSHACALMTDGGVKCWGSNWAGQVGDGTISDYRLVPVDVVGLGGDVQAIAAGYDHTCALLSTGIIKCWGLNVFYDRSPSLVPIEVAGLNDVQSISVGSHICAVTKVGKLYCWGQNESGQLGDGSQSGSRSPVLVSSLDAGVQAVAAGANHTCVLTARGELLCWGRQSFGVLGVGPTTEPTDVEAPMQVVGFFPIIQSSEPHALGSEEK